MHFLLAEKDEKIEFHSTTFFGNGPLIHCNPFHTANRTPSACPSPLYSSVNKCGFRREKQAVAVAHQRVAISQASYLHRITLANVVADDDALHDDASGARCGDG